MHFGGAMASKLFPPLVQLALLMVIGRHGALREVGTVALASSVSFLCASLAEAGFGTSLSVPRTYLKTERPPMRATRTARLSAAAAGSLLYACLWGAGLGSHRPELLILVPLPFLLALAYGYGGAMNHAAALRYEGAISALESVAVIALAVVLLPYLTDVTAVLTGLLVGRAGGTVLRAAAVRRLPTSTEPVARVARVQAPFVATTAAIVAQGQADIVLLGFMGSLAVLGVYAPLLRLAYGALLVAEALGWALYPRRREETAASAPTLGAKLVRNWRATGLVLGVVGGVGFFALAQPILEAILNRPLHGLEWPVAVLALVIAVRFASFVVAVDIVREGLQMKRLPYLVGAGALLAIGTAVSRGRSLDVLTGSRLASEAFLTLGYVAVLLSARRRPPEGLSFPERLPRAAQRLLGLRCPGCLARLRGATCACGTISRPTAYPLVVASGEPAATFAQPVDERILTDLVPGLAGLAAPSSTEAFLEQFGRDEGYELGNPVWEGRTDIGRVLPQAAGVVLDLGCGLGTNTVAMARSASHVFAVDRSLNRAALTGSRARAEGLDNVTVIHADGTTLPLGDDVCDLVLLVGVLEWVGVGADDPRAKQLEVLREVERVLKPGGRLLLGIENRWGAHYFGGAREEHTGLRYSSLLPRRIANVYSRLVRGVPITTPTYSRRGIGRLLREVGLSARFCYPLPSYSSPQWSFDEAEIAAGRRFYLKHVYHYTSLRRRLAGRLLACMPAALLEVLLPCFWVVAGSDKPGRLPALVTGRQYAAADMKVLALEQRAMARYARTSGELLATEQLVDGWNARRWVRRPLTRSARERRLVRVVCEAARLLSRRESVVADEATRDAAVVEALAGLDALAPSLDRDARDWCAQCIEAVSAMPLAAAVEHGDFLLTNLIFHRGKVTPIDCRQQQRAIVGLDAVSLLVDVLSQLGNTRETRPDVALRTAATISADIARACRLLLLSGLGDAGRSDPVSMIVFSLLRRSKTDQLAGMAELLHAASHGWLDELVTSIRVGSLTAEQRAVLRPATSAAAS